MPSQRRSSHFREVLRASISETWDAVFANHPKTVILTIAGTCLAIYLTRRYGGQSSEQMKDALISVGFGLVAYGIVFAVVFLANFCYFTPKRIIQEQQTLLSVARSKKEREEIRAKLGGFQLEIEDRVKAMENMQPTDVVTFENNLNATTVDGYFIDGILKYVMQNVGASYGAEFLMDAGLPDRPHVSGHNIKYQKHLRHLRNRALRLKQIIEQYRID
jgi:hypothetical protein